MAAWLCGRPRRLCGLGGEVGDGNHGRGKGAAVILARLQSGIMGELAKIASKVRRCETERRAYGVLGVTAGIGVDAANVGTGSLKKGVVAMLTCPQ